MHGWRACCPAHADRRPSLSISVGEQGQVLLKCFAGCSLERIVEAMGLTMTDLFPDAGLVPDGQATKLSNTRHSALTLVDLALEKQLPWKFLFHLGVMEHPGGGLHIPIICKMALWHHVTASERRFLPKRDRIGVQAQVRSCPMDWHG